MGEKQNKGEWAEPYVLLKLLGEKKLYLSDADGNKNDKAWINILQVIRHETKDRLVEYNLDPENTDVNIYINGKYRVKLNACEFLKFANRLKNDIVNGVGTFSVSEKIVAFFEKAEVTKCKASSVKKSDIFLTTYDPMTSITRVNIGFSIKSYLGENPTIFNTGHASAVIYKLVGANDKICEQINEIKNKAGHVSVIDRCAFIKDSGIRAEYFGFPVAKQAKKQTSFENFDTINPRLPKVIETILYKHFFEGEKEIDIKPLVEKLIIQNPCSLACSEIKYPTMVKNFLYAAYCGLTAGKLWNGKSELNGGYIVVKPNGDIIADYAQESEIFKEYLYERCYVDYPSTGSDHGYYGFAYKGRCEEPGIELPEEYYFRLNFQIKIRLGAR